MSPLQKPAASSQRAEATADQGLKIQREIDALDATASHDSKDKKEPAAMQAGAREYPTEFLPQHHAKPGIESEVRPWRS